MKYLAYYDIPENKAENRGFVLAATNKIDYICAALNRIGYDVEIVSASASHNRRGCKGKIVQLSDRTSLKLFPCIGTGWLPKRLMGRFILRMGLFLYLLLNTKKGENVLVYHSLGYAGTVALARKIKRFRLILEVEEIYADVNGKEWDRKREHIVFSSADAYLFPTELLNKKINTKNKPYVLIHGTYQVEPDRKCNVFRENLQGEKTRKIHCVYAGTFDPRKGGAIAAVAAAEFLPEKYHIHILGFGGKEQTKRMTELIGELAKKCSCGISYDGLLWGEDYIKFLQSCDIGLSTQNPDAAFNATSFPSKILSYMANGLRVVSIRIPAIEGSAIGEYMYYYDEQTPEAIAQAILQVDVDDGYDSRRVIKKLDMEFMKEMKILLEENCEGIKN